MSTVLLTGATGYIGSHTWLALRDAGFDVVVLNYCNWERPGLTAASKDKLQQYVEGGGGLAIVDVAAGHVPFYFGNMSAALPQVRSWPSLAPSRRERSEDRFPGMGPSTITPLRVSPLSRRARPRP